VLDGVGVVQASLLKELLKVVCGRPRLTLAAAYGGRGAHQAGAIRLLVVATIIDGRDCSLLMVLFVPLPSALLGILDDDVR
jgi:hypothetical protein